jgi:hypothetical protein
MTLSRRRRAVFGAIVIALPLLVLEATSCAISRHYRYTYFSYEREYFENVTAGDFRQFVSSDYFDRALGWDNPEAPTTVTRTNCIGQSITYHLRDGYRVTPGVAKGQELVALYGDSYTQGEEVGDESTVAGVLQRKYAIPAVNYGVNAYDPLQATGKFRATLPRIPGVKVAVLMVMHENIWRVVNSFKPVYWPYKNAFYFGLKPYVSDGRIVPLAYPTDYPAFLREAKDRFEHDYWRKPERTFPYSISLLKALRSHTVAAQFLARVRGPLVDEYQYNPVTRQAMSVVLERFVAIADSAGIRPVIVFVPRNHASYRASAPFVAMLNARWGRRLAHEFADDSLDWGAY